MLMRASSSGDICATNSAARDGFFLTASNVTFSSGFSLDITVYQGMLTVIEDWYVAVYVASAVADSQLKYTLEYTQRRPD